MKVAIVGTHKETLAQTPWDDKSWQIWGMAHRRNHYERYDQLFEMHRRSNWEDNPEFEGFLEYLDTTKEIVITKWQADYPNLLSYPLKKAIRLMGGREYFTSSFSYILAKAILYGAKEIGIYGINLTAEDEYIYQKPGAEFLLGIAVGRGIKVTVAKGAAILNAPFTYGDGKPMTHPLTAQYEERLASCQDEINRVNITLDQLTGAEHEMQEILKELKSIDRGAHND